MMFTVTWVILIKSPFLDIKLPTSLHFWGRKSDDYFFRMLIQENSSNYPFLLILEIKIHIMKKICKRTMGQQTKNLFPSQTSLISSSDKFRTMQQISNAQQSLIRGSIRTYTHAECHTAYSQRVCYPLISCT